jgi:quinol-cytochrome oxidoreductase complex cytochrome b subunit
MNLEIMSLSEAFTDFNIVIAAGLFVLYLFVEALDATLVFSITQHKSIKSAGMTFILYVVLGIEVAAIVANYLYIVPIAFGAAVGSYLVIENEKKARPLDKNKR